MHGSSKLPRDTVGLPGQASAGTTDSTYNLNVAS